MISARAEVEAVLKEMGTALDSEDRAKLVTFMRTHLDHWYGGTPAGNVLGAIYKACDQAMKGTWDHPYHGAAWTVFRIEFPDDTGAAIGT